MLCLLDSYVLCCLAAVLYIYIIKKADGVDEFLGSFSTRTCWSCCSYSGCLWPRRKEKEMRKRGGSRCLLFSSFSALFTDRYALSLASFCLLASNSLSSSSSLFFFFFSRLFNHPHNFEECAATIFSINKREEQRQDEHLRKTPSDGVEKIELFSLLHLSRSLINVGATFFLEFENAGLGRDGGRNVHLWVDR